VQSEDSEPKRATDVGVDKNITSASADRTAMGAGVRRSKVTKTGQQDTLNNTLPVDDDDM
jgi:hypothetical protein